MSGVPSGAPVVILRAGPAGLTAAYELCRYGVPSIVLEQTPWLEGRLAPLEQTGYLFDIGGHRFLTIPLIEKIWKEVLGDDHQLTGRSLYPIKPRRWTQPYVFRRSNSG